MAAILLVGTVGRKNALGYMFLGDKSRLCANKCTLQGGKKTELHRVSAAGTVPLFTLLVLISINASLLSSF